MYILVECIFRLDILHQTSRILENVNTENAKEKNVHQLNVKYIIFFVMKMCFLKNSVENFEIINHWIFHLSLSVRIIIKK